MVPRVATYEGGIVAGGWGCAHDERKHTAGGPPRGLRENRCPLQTRKQRDKRQAPNGTGMGSALYITRYQPVQLATTSPVVRTI